MEKFEIIKQTAQTMYGEIEVLGSAGIFSSWTQATCKAMELEAADLGKLYNGRKIMYHVVLA